MQNEIHFILNQEYIKTQEPAGLLVLDFLRRSKKLSGTKEGCKEGDCGACMVLVGELKDNILQYKAVTSCLMPLGELQGKHLVTIEGLNTDQLSPVQQAIVDYGGSQCGFCTPGIVVSFTGYLLQQGKTLDHAGIKYALGGNLCRCTGYSSLKRAGSHINNQLLLNSKNGNAIIELADRRFIPGYFKTIAEKLSNIPLVKQDGDSRADYFIAGGTDLYVQQGDLIPDYAVQVLNLDEDLKTIQKTDNEIHVGALTTFEEFASHPQINAIIPDIAKYNLYNASWQIRNRATLGGNIINASPIGDMTILLLALNSTLVFRNKDERHVPLKSFYKGYKQMDRHPGEILTKIIVPVPDSTCKINFEKVSKRKTLDIASVNSAMYIKVNDDKIDQIGLSMGGVAPVPLYMRETCAYLTGQKVDPDTIRQASVIAMQEIEPIDDIRGSSEYKRLLVNQFMFLHFNSLYPHKISSRAYYEA